MIENIKYNSCYLILRVIGLKVKKMNKYSCFQATNLILGVGTETFLTYFEAHPSTSSPAYVVLNSYYLL
jgi:hypothetical protein